MVTKKPQLGLDCSYHNKDETELTSIYFSEDTRTYLQKILKTKDFTYNNLKGIIYNNYLVVLKGNKDQVGLLLTNQITSVKYLR